MLAAEIYCIQPAFPQRLFWWCSAATIVLGVFLWWVSPIFGPTFWGMIFFATICFFTRRELVNPYSKYGPVRWLAGVGLMSYSLYLVHSPAIGIVRQILGPRLKTTAPGELLMNAALMAVLCCLASWTFFWLVESRFLLGKKKSGVSDKGTGSLPE